MRKRTGITLLVILLAVLMIVMTACRERDENGLYKLDKPSNLAINGSTLSWDSVSYAQIYYIAVNGEEKAETSNTTYNLAEIVSGYGNFDITVRAYGDGEKYGTSDWSDVFVYHKGNALDTPVISVNTSEKTATWQDVENCATYEIAVYDSENNLLDSKETTDTYYVFEKEDDEGNDVYADYDKYRIIVVAKPDAEDVEHDASVAGTAYYINSKVLDTPVFSSLTTTVRWEKVDDATSYTLRLTHEDGTYEEFTTTGTSYQRSKFTFSKAGNYYFTIRADGDGEVYLSSEFSERSDDYKITKLESVDAEQLSLSYGSDGKATLTWKIDANSLADNFYLGLKATLANGDVELDSSLTSKTISNVITYVVGNVYDVYIYVGPDTVAPVVGETMLVYNYDGVLKVQRDGVDYIVYDEDGNPVNYSDFTPSASVDIVYKSDAQSGMNYVLMPCEYNEADGSLAVQDTGEVQDVINSDGKQLYYFEIEDDLEITKYVEYDLEGQPAYHVFVIYLDSIFIKKEVTGEEGSEVVTYTPLISDNDYYGRLYDISIAAGNSGTKYEYGDDVYVDGQYLSYMIPTKDIYGAWYITNAGEFAFIYINSFANPYNTDTYSFGGNIDFGGYEVINLKEFYGKIDGNDHTVNNIVLTNKRLTSEGVQVVYDSEEVLSYSLFGDIKEGATVNRIFFLGVQISEIDYENLPEGLKTINIALFAINNYGEISQVVVQTDSIEAESANIAGFVLNNYNYIANVQVYATLKGRNVAGITINNKSTSAAAFARLLYCGFYGSIECNVGEYLNDEVREIYGAGLAIVNETVATDGTSALINGCYTIGSVIVNGEALDGVYSAGLVAVNKSYVYNSYSGEFTLNNIYESVTANGNNGYAGGLIAHNIGTVENCYSTDKASASTYAGGLIGFNEGTVKSCYSTGNTTVGGLYNGAFAGLSTGTIENCVSYSQDSWAKDLYTEIFTTSDKLLSITDVLYPDGNAKMTLVSGEGYRNPLINGLIYTKDYTVTMLPATSDVVATGIIVDDNGEITEIEGDGENIFGTITKGNRVVVALTSGGVTRYVYGTVK